MNTPALRVEVWRNPGLVRGAALRHLLGHKGAPWLAHLDDLFARADADCREGLETSYFVAVDGGAPVANIALWDDGCVGLLGHVYTMESHRGLGLAGALLDALIDEAQSRGVRTVALNATVGSFQQRFYAGRGFVAVAGLPGAMVRGAQARDDEGAAGVWRPFTWRDWPGLNVVALDPQAPGWRGLGHEERGSIEHALLEAAYARLSPGAVAAGIRVLRRGDAVAGWVSLLPGVDAAGAPTLWLDACWPGGCEEGAVEAARELLAGAGGEVCAKGWGSAAERLLNTLGSDFIKD